MHQVGDLRAGGWPPSGAAGSHAYRSGRCRLAHEPLWPLPAGTPTAPAAVCTPALLRAREGEPRGTV